MNITIIPAVDQEYSPDFSAQAATSAMTIRVNYNDIIQAASAAFGIDPNVVIGYMVVEDTEVNPGALSPAGAIGLLQLEPATAFQTLKDQAPSMPQGLTDLVNIYLPGFLKGGGFVGFYANWKTQLETVLVQPDFNIWVGVCQLAQLANKSQKLDGGVVRVDHVTVMYNAGVTNYYKYVIDEGLAGADTAGLIAQLAIKESKDYIIKLMGTNGAIMAALRTQ